MHYVDGVVVLLLRQWDWHLISREQKVVHLVNVEVVGSGRRVIDDPVLDGSLGGVDIGVRLFGVWDVRLVSGSRH